MSLAAGEFQSTPGNQESGMRMTLLWFCVGLAGCARHDVRCDAHLHAINPPARASAVPRTPPTAPAPAGTASYGRSAP